MPPSAKRRKAPASLISNRPGGQRRSFAEATLLAAIEKTITPTMQRPGRVTLTWPERAS